MARVLGAARLSHRTDESTSIERQREQIRRAVQLREISCSGAGGQPGVLGDGPDEAGRQVVPLELVV